jgi:hypothetical protein
MNEPRKTNLPCAEITDKIIRAFYKTMDTLGTVRGKGPWKCPEQQA